MIQQRIHIQSGSADKNRQLAARNNIANYLASVMDERRDGIGFIRWNKIHQMMRDSLHFFCCRFCSGDLHSLVNLYGIGRNDFSVVALRKFHRKPGFSGSGRADNRNESDFIFQAITPCQIVFQFRSFSSRCTRVCSGDNSESAGFPPASLRYQLILLWNYDFLP